VWPTHSLEDLKNLRSATNHYHAAIIKAKRTYNSSLISSSSTNPRQLWKNINILTIVDHTETLTLTVKSIKTVLTGERFVKTFLTFGV